MSYQIIRQPDGKLAVFSTYDDRWACWDLTPRRVAKWFARQAFRDVFEAAMRKARLVAAGDASKAYGRNLAIDFASANARSSFHGGVVLEGPVDEELIEVLTNGLDDDDPES